MSDESATLDELRRRIAIYQDREEAKEINRLHDAFAAKSREITKLSEALKEHCFYATKKAGFSREGSTLETTYDTAYRDIEYRGCPLFDTSEEAVNHYLKAP